MSISQDIIDDAIATRDKALQLKARGVHTRIYVTGENAELYFAQRWSLGEDAPKIEIPAPEVCSTTAIQALQLAVGKDWVTTAHIMEP